MNELLIATQKTSAVEVDPYYNLVSLHLKGDVNTGRSYNAFSDASSNNFRLTNNGDVRGSSFSPYGTSWSGTFNGSSDYLSVAAPTMTGNWTIEFWWYPTVGGATSQAFFTATDSANSVKIHAWSSNNQLIIDNGVTGQSSFTNVNFTLNQWNHIAFVRNGATTSGYINGVFAGSNSFVPGSGITQCRIGSNIGVFFVAGQLSNFRVVDGVAVYSGTSTTTANFAVPTSPLSATQSAGTNIAAITGTATSILALQSNRFVDQSSSPKTITVNGSPRISSFSPFLETDTTSGSGYFDGNADYLDVTSASFNPAGAFTVEFWFYPTDGATQYQGLLTSWPSGLSPAQGIIIWKSGTSGNDAEVGIGGPSTGYTNIGFFAWASCLNRWNHLVLVRNSSDSCATFLNGSRLAAPVTKSGAPGQTALSVGRSFPNITNYYFQGYISNLHFVSGSSLYDPALSTIPVPTVPITKVTNTALLTLQERGAYNTIGFQDESEYQHVITRPSGANVAQGTFSPFSNSGWSNYFSGSGTSIQVASNTALQLSTSVSWCLEAFVFPISLSSDRGIITKRSGTTYEYQFSSNASGLNFWNGSTTYTAGQSLTANQWQHVACTWDGTTLRFFINGAMTPNTYTSTFSMIASSTSTVNIGANLTNGGGENWNGYISNARIVKGSAVYTSSFPPITVPLTAISGTSLLTCQSNRFIDNSSNAFAITVNGSPQVQAFSPFKPVAYDPAVHGGSGYFDGSGDYLTGPTNTATAFNLTGDFTIESWCYFTTVATSFAGIVSWADSSGWNGWQFTNDAGVIKFQFLTGSAGVGTVTASSSVTANQWYHLAVARAGSTITLYINGTNSGTATYSSSQTSASSFIRIAADRLATSLSTGYLSNVRIVNGTAVYTGNFTPPSGPLPLLGNTSLLLNFTNGGVIDSTGKNVIETVGNAGVVTTAIKKFGSGSMYFDGTGDYLQQPLTNLLSFAENTYTIEAWIYPTTSSGYRRIFSTSTSAAATVGYLALVVNGTSLVGETRPTNNGAVTTISGGTVNANTWYHAALSVNNGSARLFLDGVQVGSTTSFPALAAMNYVTVGAILYNSGASTTDFFTGYIDDLRITKGYARYVEGTGANAGKMVFNGTNTLALPTKAHPDSGVLSTLTTSMVAPSTVDYLVVGGGGGGGRENFSSGLGGGGGAGGFITGATTVSAATNYVITVGGGGPGLTAAGTSNDGFPSSIVGGTSPSAFTIPGVVAAGGGGGGGGTSPGIAGRAGGSGGGGGTPSPSNGGAASPAGQGNAGGPYSATSPNSGGGGGGAGEAGNTDGQGEGGDGTASSISGSLVTYAGGGGGGASFLTKSGGLGGGGDGGNAPSGPSAQPGGTNTGGGGGGGFNSTPGGTSGAGGSGIVIIAYPSTFKPLKASLGLVYTIDTVTRAGYRVYKFIAGTGTISW